MQPQIVIWDGEKTPEVFRNLPPGRYILESADEPLLLSPEEDAGIQAALDELDAGNGIPLGQAIERL
jgi:Uma2 family endonuclease